MGQRREVDFYPLCMLGPGGEVLLLKVKVWGPAPEWARDEHEPICDFTGGPTSHLRTHLLGSLPGANLEYYY